MPNEVIYMFEQKYSVIWDFYGYYLGNQFLVSKHRSDNRNCQPKWLFHLKYIFQRETLRNSYFTQSKDLHKAGEKHLEREVKQKVLCFLAFCMSQKTHWNAPLSMAPGMDWPVWKEEKADTGIESWDWMTWYCGWRSLNMSKAQGVYHIGLNPEVVIA